MTDKAKGTVQLRFNENTVECVVQDGRYVPVLNSGVSYPFNGDHAVKDTEPHCWKIDDQGGAAVDEEYALDQARERCQDYGNDVFLVRMDWQDWQDTQRYYVVNELYLQQPEFKAFCGVVVEDIVLDTRNRVFQQEIAGYKIEVWQDETDDFTVQYGKQIKKNLNYGQAAKELGVAIFHALACEGKLDNRTLEEAKEDT